MYRSFLIKFVFIFFSIVTGLSLFADSKVDWMNEEEKAKTI